MLIGPSNPRNTTRASASGPVRGALWICGLALLYLPAPVLAVPAGKADASEAATPADDPGDLTASQLSVQGREAFDRQDYTKAESLFDQLVGDYGENPDAAGLVNESRPLLAMCKLKRGVFDEALALIDGSLTDPKLPADAREELLFWRGICLFRTEDVQAAQEQFGEFYADKSHDRTRRYEAFLLFGTGYIQLDDFEGAADFFADQLPKLPPDQQEIAGRARVLLLHSLIQAERMDAALQLVRESFPHLGEMTQVVSFQLLTMQLGATFLENDNGYAAIACLNRLWPRERLLAHQEARLREWEVRRELLRKQGAKREALVFQIDGVLTRIRRELEQFRAIQSYDASVQLRLAQAFMGLDRWREAAAILDHAVSTLPADPLLPQAALTEMRCWLQIQRWDRVLTACDRCAEMFPDDDSAERQEILLTRGDALRGLRQLEPAERQYGSLAHAAPDSQTAPRALFMAGMCQLELDRPEAAVATMQMIRRDYPESRLTADTLYWEGMALTFQKAWDEAREVLAACQKADPDGRWAGDAAFERARCLHNQLRHEAAVPEFRSFLTEFKDHPRVAEARLLLGEALMAIGDMRPGMKELALVPPDETRLFEEAQFRIGEGLRKLEDPAAAQAHFAAFITANPRSRRLAEAVMWQGRAAQQQGHAEDARTLYWDTLTSLGDDPANEGVEDLLLALRRLYPGADGDQSLDFRLDQLQREARVDGRKTLAARVQWARGNLLRAKHPERARVLFLTLGELLDPAIHSPRLLADCADARLDSGAPAIARDLYEDLRKWHPRALERERASWGLGRIALAAGDKTAAIGWFERCERESVAGTCGGDAMLEHATLLREAGDPVDAGLLLQRVIGDRAMSARQKARALLGLGRLAMDRQDAEHAAIHFERCYLSGAKFRDTAAEARLAHGQALETLQRKEDAAAVYRELVAHRDLSALPPAHEARERLKTLTGGVP